MKYTIHLLQMWSVFEEPSRSSGSSVSRKTAFSRPRGSTGSWPKCFPLLPAEVQRCQIRPTKNRKRLVEALMSPPHIRLNLNNKKKLWSINLKKLYLGQNLIVLQMLPFLRSTLLVPISVIWFCVNYRQFCYLSQKNKLSKIVSEERYENANDQFKASENILKNLRLHYPVTIC